MNHFAIALLISGIHRKIALSPRKLVKRKIRRLKHDAESTAQRGVEEEGRGYCVFCCCCCCFSFYPLSVKIDCPFRTTDILTNLPPFSLHFFLSSLRLSIGGFLLHLSTYNKGLVICYILINLFYLL